MSKRFVDLPNPLTYVCRGCGNEFDIFVEPFIPARTYGPPEDCRPAEGGEVNPDCCPECMEPVSPEAAQGLLADEKEAAEEDYYEQKADLARERDEEGYDDE